jgi:hypothetical protein
MIDRKVRRGDVHYHRLLGNQTLSYICEGVGFKGTGLEGPRWLSVDRPSDISIVARLILEAWGGVSHRTDKSVGTSTAKGRALPLHAPKVI